MIGKLDELNKQIESLVKQKFEIEDTIIKAELAKSRFRFLDYGNFKYWIKIIDISADKCLVLELYADYENSSIKIAKTEESLKWVYFTIPVVEEIFKAKYKEFIDKLKI